MGDLLKMLIRGTSLKDPNMYCTPADWKLSFFSGWTALFREMLMAYNSGKFIAWLWSEFCGLKKINILY